MLAVGLMSGTSLDGIDAALCEIEGQGRKTQCHLIAFETLDMPLDLKEKIKKACCIEESNSELICELNFELGNIFADAVAKVCAKAQVDPHTLDYVASHGQTIYHISRKQKGLPSTLQIGEPALISYRFNVPTVSNFRVMDIAAGGEGAPLVPYSEYVLYSSDEKNIALQNIGGIGNVTYLKKQGSLEEVFAFDTGPGNMMIDEAMVTLFNQKYDEDGKIAAMGHVDETLYQELKKHSYFDRKPPKSTGREEFGQAFTQDILRRYAHLSKEDMITTLTQFTAYSIGRSISDFILKEHDLDTLIVAGGGANNPTLMKMIQKELTSIEVISQNDLGYSNDAKEAIAFAIMGNETLHHHFSNVKSATGAKRNVVLGMITPRPYEEE